ncbi:transglycosylase domain-containing protein [Anaerobacillus sp. MEB173]|uniref:transglycosylase domain-containing protein n=1 Tax=Anaerobacillus sp. MEB173 TaxID=3383345 RepID=UPI003F9005FC
MEILTNKRLKSSWRRFRLLFRLTLLVAIIIMGALVALLTYTKMQGPPPIQVQQTTVIYGNDNSIIGEKHYGQNRHWVPLDEISTDLIHATLAIEDRKFYSHFGFDIIRIGGAALTNIRKGTKAQGASTITQQYARNLYLGHDKTWKRKMNEALYALRLEMNYSKDKILEGYLNTIYYGHGAYGIEAASNLYFNKSAKDLTLAEASMLAGVPKGPSYYSPLSNFERAKTRQEIILNAMAENGYITPIMAKQTAREELQFESSEEQVETTIGPYFQDVVKRILVEEYDIDQNVIESGGLRVYTTLDPDMQQKAELWVKNEIDPASDIQGALVAMDPRNGDVKALIGGRNYQESQFNIATQARRPAGSTFKPFLYYAALEQGFTPATTLLSEPTTFLYDDERKEYSPGNFNDKYANDFITMAQALALSDNIYAVKTHMFLGMDYLVETAKNLGITSPLKSLPSSALGTNPVGVLEMVKAYGAFANGGRAVEPRFIKKVVDRDGNTLFEQNPKLEHVLNPDLAFVMTDMMTGMFDSSLNDYTSVTGSSIANLITRPMAGKSGSTSTDSWMIGYTPQLVTGVWIGYEYGKTLHPINDTQYSKKIWVKFMEDALQDQPVLPFRRTSGVVGLYINPKNGFLATDACPVQRLTYFAKGTEPTEYCMEHIEDPSVDHGEPEVIDPEQKDKFLDRFKKWFH